jgi:SAM-dependent MidA family methyltransferase
VIETLRERIACDGPIRFRDFMAAVLYDPAHGYYGSGRAAIGRGGDFFTNVSVGPLFGQLLARQFAEMWTRLGQPVDFTIVEQGAHRGDFARDVFGALASFAPECLAAMRYRIVEPVPALRAAQEAALGANATWHATIEELPPFTGVHFSNELLDAMPVHLVTWTGAEWLERYVSADDGGFRFTDGPLSSEALRERVATIPPVPEGYATEVNLEALAWVDAVAARLSRGWVLTIDYGFERAEFFAPERRTGTLRAYSHHRVEADPLARPGALDLTAHVEFTSIIERAARAGCDLAGFTDQHHFMVGLGQLHFRDDAVPEMAELRAYKTLMHPTMMGTSFHALCFAKGAALSPPLAGFKFARQGGADCKSAPR